MDKIRAFLNVVWTQRFWVLSVIGVLVGVLCWKMAATDLTDQFTKRKGEIDGAFKTVSGIKNEPTHPNEDVIQGDVQQASQQRDYVLEVWQGLYDRQRTEVTKWPESLGQPFLNHMKGRKFGDSISNRYRERYLNYIETRFDALLDIVKAQKGGATGAMGRGGYGGAGEYGGGGEYGVPGAGGADEEAAEEDDYLVQWLDQGKLQQKLSFKSTPSDMQVWVTQEDLWVYETLLGVIADTNKACGATRPDNTAVRAIIELQVGSEAATPATEKVLIPAGGGGAGGELGGEYGAGGGEYGRPGGGEYGAGGGEYGRGEFGGGEYGRDGGGGGVDDTALVSNRYLDTEGNPVEVTPGSYGSTEFRKLPIRMTLLMDQRYIPRVLIECANAALPVEVKQLSVNPDQSGEGFGGDRAGGGRGGYAVQGGADANDPTLATVDIRGVVYIYNEPDKEVMTVPGEAEAAPAGDESVSTNPPQDLAAKL